jgi:REase_DpnII-MboI
MSQEGCGELQGSKLPEGSSARIRAQMSGPVPLGDVGSVLPALEDEIFFAVLDVALDIQSELQVGSDPIFIPLRRVAVRYTLLCPVAQISVGAIDRYCDLRWKAGSFLKRYGLVGSFEWCEQYGQHRWQSQVEVTVPRTSHFADFLAQLRIEESRRSPGQQMEADISSATAQLVQLADSFSRVALRLRTRRAGSTPLLIEDEYDVQYVFSALLLTRFDDIRPEEWGPSYAGGSNRVDFLLKNELVVLETKMTRAGLPDRRLGEELIIDIAHYKQKQNCRALVCFVYDPDHQLKNPIAIENDLSKPTDGFDVRVLIRPRA